VRVVVLTTLVSALVFAGLWAAVRYDVLNLERLLGRPAAI
jgi:predicted secreted protein